MSFLDYLKDNRGLFIDHRSEPPASAGIPVPDPDNGAMLDDATGIAGTGASSTRRRRARRTPRGVRYRHLQPAFAPSPYSDPLPYEESWERAWR